MEKKQNLLLEESKKLHNKRLGLWNLEHTSVKIENSPHYKYLGRFWSTRIPENRSTAIIFAGMFLWKTEFLERNLQGRYQVSRFDSTQIWKSRSVHNKKVSGQYAQSSFWCRNKIVSFLISVPQKCRNFVYDLGWRNQTCSFEKTRFL